LINYGKKLLGEVKQNNEKATYCTKIEKEDGEINPYQNTLQEIYSKYRAYYIRPKIFFNQGDLKSSKRVIIENLKLDQNLFESEKGKPMFD
jgi:methionyl-tRNA formyltransferase